MGLGIIEPRNNKNVPGTSNILGGGGLELLSAEELANPNLKYDTSGPVPIVLVPQPSDDPNDPLNWSLLKRDLILLALCSISVIATTLSPILAADSFTLALFLEVSFNDVALLTGYHLLGVGIGGFIFVPSARVWGKRHLYILGTIIVCACSAWGGACGRNYTSLLWARLFQGIGLAPFEALVNASVGDMYCLHQRGKRMALTTVSLFGAAFLTPVIVGKISYTIGYQWSFYLVSIFSGALLPVIVLFVPETAFVRSAKLNTDFGAISGTGSEDEKKSAGVVETEQRDSDVAKDEADLSPSSSDAPETSPSSSPAKKGSSTRLALPLRPLVSFWKWLKPFNGRKTHESYWKLLLRPLPLFLHPGIAWACLTQGVLIGWTVLTGVVLGGLLTFQPPYYWGPIQVGYMYSSAFIGSMIGFVFCGLISDPMARWLTKKNGGTYEPEFRLILALPQLIFGCAGLYGFGWSIEEMGILYSWIVPEVFFCFILIGMVCGAVAAALYLVDAHREIAIEAFTCMMVFKNVFSFAITFHGYEWVRGLGSKELFIIIGSVQVGVCLLAWVLYFFGKLNRSFFSKYDIPAICRLR